MAAATTLAEWWIVPVAFLIAYLIGSIPFAYLIVRGVTGEDITTHGSGNVGSMNVRRTTGSWTWFVVAVLGDGLKGLVPTFLAKTAATETSTLLTEAVRPWALTVESAGAGWWALPQLWIPMAVVAGAVLGHNYSAWMALIERRIGRTGKGLATGGGALLAYDWRYFVAVLLVGLTVIAVTRYLMAGQVAAALTLPVTAWILGSPDWPFALGMGAIVYAAHHRRFVGMLAGREPRLYIHDDSGPRG